MGLFSVAKLFGITIRESANDGSDFSNPDADYRRLFLGEDGQLHVKDSAGAVTDIASVTTSGKATRTAGNLTYTSATFADVTGMSVTITTKARRCLVVVTAVVEHSVGTFSVNLDVDIDGTRQGNGLWGLMRAQAWNAAGKANGCFSYVTDVLSAASHTFKLQAATDGSTATVHANTDQPLIMAVHELA